MNLWTGQKGSKATGNGLKPRYRLYIFETLHRKLIYSRKIWRFSKKIFSDSTLEKLPNRQAAPLNPSISFLLILYSKKYTKVQFLQTLKSTRSYEYFEPYSGQSCLVTISSYFLIQNKSVASRLSGGFVEWKICWEPAF